MKEQGINPTQLTERIYGPDHSLITARAPKDESDHRGAAFRQIRDECLDGTVLSRNRAALKQKCHECDVEAP